MDCDFPKIFIYSDTIILFLKRLKNYAFDILKNEMRLKVGRNRFHFNHYTYPLQLVLFEAKNPLGFFQSNTYQIGINKSLMFESNVNVIKDLLRHELAHFYTYIKYSSIYENIPSHGNEFKEICDFFWPSKNIHQAQVKLNDEQIKINSEKIDQTQKVLDKIKKLLRLSTGENKHEAELATLKANQLLIDYNLKLINPNDVNRKIDEDEEEIYLKRVFVGKKVTKKWMVIFNILRHFFVFPVLNHGKKIVYLEITGSKINVELADYYAQYLFVELENLWNFYRHKYSSSLQSLNKIHAKNSFMEGAGEGLLTRLELENLETKKKFKNELLVLNRDLEKKVKCVYSGLSSSREKGQKANNFAKNLGNKAQESIQFKKGIMSDLKSSQGKTKLLTFS